MKRINFYIPAPMLDSLQSLANKQDVSLAELIRKAIGQFLKTQK